MKYNLPMAISNLTNMSNDLNLDQGDIYKSKNNLAIEFSRTNLAGQFQLN